MKIERRKISMKTLNPMQRNNKTDERQINLKTVHATICHAKVGGILFKRKATACTIVGQEQMKK